MPLARTTILHWREDYQSRESHAHWGGNRRPKTSEEMKICVSQQLNDHIRLSLRTVASELRSIIMQYGIFKKRIEIILKI